MGKIKEIITIMNSKEHPDIHIELVTPRSQELDRHPVIDYLNDAGNELN